MTNPLDEYAESVITGNVAAGKLVHRAVERHIRDRETGASRGLLFDFEAAAKAIRFFSQLKHSKGEWAGQAFDLAPWQQFIVGSLFGWKRGDGTRRFRVCYGEVPRKNGKSTLLAGVGLYVTFFDGEPGAEGYVAATKKDQAKIIWSEAERMVQASPALRARLNIMKASSNIHSVATSSKFEAVGADADTLDGLNIHFAAIDELHAHKTDAVWGVLDTATGARRQPLIFAITTAGSSRTTVCWAQHEYAEKVLSRVIEDDSFFAYIAGVDEGDDWQDEKVWQKANPNFGVSVNVDDLRRKFAKAREILSEQNIVKRLHLDMWTEQADRWLDMDVWDAQEIPRDLDSLAGRVCHLGIDLSSTEDITAAVAWFPDGDGNGGDVLCYFWVPEVRLAERSRRDRVPYDMWSAQGHIEKTDGDTIDQDRIFRQVVELGERYQIRSIAIDRWEASQLIVKLERAGFTVVKHGQGMASMAGPTKELNRVVLLRKVRHGNNPVLRWMASNVAVESDAEGNQKVSKGKSRERVDGIVALTMAMGESSMFAETTTGKAPNFWTFEEDEDPLEANAT